MRQHIVLRRNRPSISFRLGVGSLLVFVGALTGALALFAVGVGSGDYPLSPLDVLATLAGGGDETSRFVVWTLRLPRLLAAVLVKRVLWALLAMLAVAIAACTPGGAPGQDANDPATLPSATPLAGDDGDGNGDDGDATGDPTGDGITGG